MTIRKANEADTEIIADLILAAIGDIGQQLTGEKETERIRQRLESFIKEKGNRFSYDLIQVKEEDGQTVGFILGYHGTEVAELYAPIEEHVRKVTGNEQFVSDSESEADEYYIDSLAVDAQHRGKGFAKQLILATEQVALECGYDKISLNVDYENPHARKIYENLGYVTNKTIQLNGHSFYHMVKLLN